MKKKYRRAVYFILIGILYIITLPFLLVGLALEKLAIAECKFGDWLKTKLRVYDTDPE